MLEVRNITKVFQDPKKKGAPVEALNNVSFNLEKGQFNTGSVRCRLSAPQLNPHSRMKVYLFNVEA